MDKITTPIAILISGILIFIGLLMNYNNSKWFVVKHMYKGEFNTMQPYVVKTNIHTGYSCERKFHSQKTWFCSDTDIKEWDKENEGIR